MKQLESLDAATLKEIGLHIQDVQELQRTGKTAAKAAVRVANRARRHTSDTSSQQRHGDSPHGSPSVYVTSTHSNRSSSPIVSLAPQNRRSRSSRPPPAPQPRGQSVSQARENIRSPSIAASRGRQPVGRIDTPAKLKSRHLQVLHQASSSSASTHSLPISCSSDASSSYVTIPVADPTRGIRRERSRIYGHRVRDDGTGTTVEVSEWPAGLFGSDEDLASPSRERLNLSGHVNRGRSDNGQGPRGNRRSSSIVSRSASIYEQRGARKKKLGEEYKPSGLSTESDREKRNRRRHRRDRTSED